MGSTQVPSSPLALCAAHVLPHKGKAYILSICRLLVLEFVAGGLQLRIHLRLEFQRICQLGDLVLVSCRI